MNTSILLVAVLAIAFVFTLPAILRGVEKSLERSYDKHGHSSRVPASAVSAQQVATRTTRASGAAMMPVADQATDAPEISLRRPVPQFNVVHGYMEDQAVETLPMAVGMSGPLPTSANVTVLHATPSQTSSMAGGAENVQPSVSTTRSTRTAQFSTLDTNMTNRPEPSHNTSRMPGGRAHHPQGSRRSGKSLPAQNLKQNPQSRQVQPNQHPVPGPTRQTKQVLGVVFALSGCAALVTLILALLSIVPWAVPVLLAALSLGALTVVFALNTTTTSAQSNLGAAAVAQRKAVNPGKRQQKNPQAAKPARQGVQARPVRQNAQVKSAASQASARKGSVRQGARPQAAVSRAHRTRVRQVVVQEPAAGEVAAEVARTKAEAARRNKAQRAQEPLTDEIPIVQSSQAAPQRATTVRVKHRGASQVPQVTSTPEQSAQTQAPIGNDALDQAMLLQGLVTKDTAGVELHLGRPTHVEHNHEAAGKESTVPAQSQSQWTPRELPVPTYVDAPLAAERETTPMETAQTSYGTSPAKREELAASFAAELGFRDEFDDATGSQEQGQEQAKRHARAAIRSEQQLAKDTDGAVVIDDVLARRRA